MTPSPAAQVAVAHWTIVPRSWRPLPQGNINESHLVEAQDGGRYVLQRVSKIFDPRVCRDIQRVTAHLTQKGLTSPRIVPTAEGEASATADGATWRLSTWVPGRVFARVAAPWQAQEAGRALAAFHGAMQDFDTPFEARRLGVHDTPVHMSGLASAVNDCVDAPRRAEALPVAEAIAGFWDDMPHLDATPERVVHGDPKLANLVFAEDEDVWRAWIDLDTVGRMALPLELGDAFRSWCQPAGEDAEGRFDLEVFEAGCRGYAQACPEELAPEAKAQLVRATEHIAIELAARFCRDAFELRYFGWDSTRFPDAGAHHLARARSQLAFARAVREARKEAEARCAAAFGPIDGHP